MVMVAEVTVIPNQGERELRRLRIGGRFHTAIVQTVAVICGMQIHVLLPLCRALRWLMHCRHQYPPPLKPDHL